MQRSLALILCASVAGCATVQRDERFVIHNHGGFTAEEVERVRADLDAGTRALEKYLGGSIAPGKFPVEVRLRPGPGVSNARTGALELFWVRERRSPVIHELTHKLAGYRPWVGHWSQEGFASYMQDKYGQDAAFPTHRMAHALVKVLREDGTLLRMGDVMADRQAAQYFGIRNGWLRWLAYTQSTSLCTYLIETYGAQRFLKVYDVAVERADFSGVYGKSADALIEEWLQYVAALPVDLSAARAMVQRMKQ